MKIRTLVCVAVCMLMLSATYVHAQCADGCSVPLNSYFNGGNQGCASNGCASNVSDCGASCGCNSNGCASGIGSGLGCGDGGCGGMAGFGSGGNSFATTNYLSVFGGWTDWFDLDATITATGLVNTTANLGLNTKDGFGVGCAWGRYWNERLRSEIEFAYRNNDFESFNATATGIGAAQGPLNGDVRTFSGMQNLYFDFNKIGNFQPYVGGGVGFAFVETSVNANLLATPIVIGTETSTFAYQFMGGVTYQWTDRIDLFGEYRLFGIDDLDVSLGAPTVPLNANLNFGGSTHNVFFGARINM